MKKITAFKAETILVVCLFFLALAIRFYKLNVMMPVTYDQGRDLLVLLEMSLGDLRLIGPTTGIPGFFLGPFFYYLLLPGFLLGNASPIAVAYWNMLLVTLCVPVVYYILKPMIGKWLALVSLVGIILTPQAIDDARLIWNPSQTVGVMLLSIWFLFKSKKKPIYFAVATFLFGLALQTEFAYVIFVVPVYVWWLFAKFFPKPKLTYSWKITALAAIAFGLTFVPQIVFDLRNEFLITKSLVGEIQDDTKKVPYQMIFKERPGQIYRALKGQMFGHIKYDDVLFIGLLVICVWPFFVRKKAKQELFLLLYATFPPLGMLFFRGNYGHFFDYYISAHYLPLWMCFVLGLSKLPYQKITGLIIILLMVVVFSFYQPVLYNTVTSGYSIEKQTKAILFAESRVTQQAASLEVFVPNLLPEQYRFLHFWLSKNGQIKKLEFESNNQNQEFFLLYEPSLGAASQAEFERWYQRIRSDSNCNLNQKFGIITIERCFREKI